MSRTIVFLVGVPGVGKSAVVRALLGPSTSEVQRWTLGEAGFCALGPYTGDAHDGGDALPHSTVLVERSIERITDPAGPVPAHFVALLDGVRFGKRSLDLARARGARTLGIMLAADPLTIHARRIQRGSPVVPQSLLQGHAARARQLVAACDASTVVNADQLVARVAEEVRAFVGRRSVLSAAEKGATG